MTNLLKQSFLGAIFVLIAFTQLTAQNKEYKGLLWEISGNGMKKPSYLYGTMHVSKKLAFNLSDTFHLAIRNSDYICLETDPDTWLDYFLNPEFMQMVMPSYWSNDSRDFYKKIFPVSFPEPVVFQSSFDHNPEMLNGLLYRFEAGNDNYEENTYLDMFIYQYGKKLHKNISQLETERESMGLMLRAIDATRENKEENWGAKFFEKLNKEEKDLGEYLEDIYRKGDLTKLDSINNLMYAPSYFKYFIQERNKNMARRMDSLMKMGAVFAGIGASHLPGNHGVLNLLRERGYSVRAIVHSEGKVAKKLKKEIDQTILPLELHQYTAPDGLFTVNVPGKQLEIPFVNGVHALTFPDMANGAAYWIIRISTFGKLMGKTEEYVLKQVDSLLYEKIPGQIFKKELIHSNTGLPGYDILSKTKRGELLRFKIFSTPMEFIIFKMNGQDEFALGKEPQEFFNSIKFKSLNDNNWTTLNSNFASASVLFPSTFKVDKKESIVTYQAVDDKGAYLFQSTAYHDYKYIEEDTFELGQITSQFIKNFAINELSKSYGIYKKYPCADLKYKLTNEESYLYLKIVIRGPYFYLLAAKTAESSVPEKYFNSLEFTNPIYISGLAPYADTNLRFVGLFPRKEIDKREKYQTIIELYNPSIIGIEKPKAEDKYKYQNAAYVLAPDESTEAIKLDYEKFHKFDSPKDKDKFWEQQEKSFQFSKEMKFTKKSIKQHGDQNIYEALICDSTSSRAIKVKMIQENGSLYTIRVVTDTMETITPWVKSFFETFQPIDSITGTDLFSDKTKLFIEALKSSDTTLNKQAEESFDEFSPKDKDAAQMIAFIRSPEYFNVGLEKRSLLISNAGLIHHPSMIPFLKELYHKNSDTSTIQIAILDALASNRTKEATIAFLELITKETPLSSDEISIFYPYNDTVELAQYLFPGLLEIIKYNEYKSNVYWILAGVTDKKLITQDKILPYKTRILKDANDEYKRLLNNIEAKEDDAKYAGYSNYDEEKDDNLKSLYGSSESHQLINAFCRILIPMYKDPAVKYYFDKLEKVKDDQLKLFLSLLYAKNKIAVPDTNWKYLAKKDNFRGVLYTELKKMKMQNKIDSTYKNQASFAMASLYNPTGSEKLTGNKIDSIQFISSKFVKVKGGEGYVYFYTYRYKDYEDETKYGFAYTGLIPSDKSKYELISGIDLVESEEYDPKTTTVEEMIDESVESILLYKRLRANGYKQNFNFDL